MKLGSVSVYNLKDGTQMYRFDCPHCRRTWRGLVTYWGAKQSLDQHRENCPKRPQGKEENQ